MLLPITNAVYVSGKLSSNDKILIDIGTGYFAEVCEQCKAQADLHTSNFVSGQEFVVALLQRTPADGVDFCRRKVSMLRENLDKIGQVSLQYHLPV